MATKRRTAPPRPVSQMIFGDWDIKEAAKQLAAFLNPLAKINKLFHSGDHWQDSNGYIGPRPSESDSGSGEMMDSLKRGFVSRNVIKEICRRNRGGVLGIEPRWAYVLRKTPNTKDETTLTAQPDTATTTIKQLEEDVTVWWNLRKVHDVFKQAAETTLWGERSVIRLFIPAGLLPGTGVKRPSTLASALRYIYVEALDPEQAGMVTDPETEVQAGVMVVEETDANGRVRQTGELVYPAEPFLDPENPPDTIVRAINDQDEGTPFPMQLGGRLTMFEMRRPLLINEQMQQSQRALNLDITIMPRNIIHGGFLARLFFNAQMPGEWEKDDKGNKIKFIPNPLYLGSGTANFVSGQEVEDAATGKTTLTTPQYVKEDPTDVQFAINAKNSHYEDMLEEADQAHVLITGDATPSGKSRQEARADFENSLRDTQTPAQDAGQWLLETVLALAEFLMGSPGKWTAQYRAEFECFIDSGPVDSTEELSVVQLREADLLSEETAMSRVRVLDTRAERARRNAEPGGNLGLRKKQFDTLTVAAAIPGVGLDGAAEFLGFTPSEIATLKKGAVDPVEQAAKLAAATGKLTPAGGSSDGPGGPPASRDGGRGQPVRNGGTPQPGARNGTKAPQAR